MIIKQALLLPDPVLSKQAQKIERHGQVQKMLWEICKECSVLHFPAPKKGGYRQKASLFSEFHPPYPMSTLPSYSQLQITSWEFRKIWTGGKEAALYVSASVNGQQDLGNLRTAGPLALQKKKKDISGNRIPTPTGASPLCTSLTQASEPLPDEMNTDTIQGQPLPFWLT